MRNNEKANRITKERERLGYTIPQFAVLVGISEARQTAIEAGDFSAYPVSYELAAQRLGADPLFIHGQSADPESLRQDLFFGDEHFLAAVGLLRKSKQAVDAFMGEGTSISAPALVAALMNATLSQRSVIGAGDLEDFADKIANAIDGAGNQIAEALKPDFED